MTTQTLVGHSRILAPPLPFTRVRSNDVGADGNLPLNFASAERFNWKHQ
jgi:hypothetical protein